MISIVTYQWSDFLFMMSLWFLILCFLFLLRELSSSLSASASARDQATRYNASTRKNTENMTCWWTRNVNEYNILIVKYNFFFSFRSVSHLWSSSVYLRMYRVRASRINARHDDDIQRCAVHVPSSELWTRFHACFLWRVDTRNRPDVILFQFQQRLSDEETEEDQMVHVPCLTRGAPFSSFIWFWGFYFFVSHFTIHNSHTMRDSELSESYLEALDSHMEVELREEWRT